MIMIMIMIIFIFIMDGILLFVRKKAGEEKLGGEREERGGLCPRRGNDQQLAASPHTSHPPQMSSSLQNTRSFNSCHSNQKRAEKARRFTNTNVD